LLLGLARLALMDSFTVFWVTLSAWLFLEMLAAPRSWRWQGAFACAFTLAILTKELSVFMGPPLAAAALLERLVRKRQLPLGRFALALAAPAAVSGVVFLMAAGGMGPFVTMAKLVLASPATNEFAVQYCSGPWYRYLIDYLCLSPAPTLLALFGVGALIQRVSAADWSTPEILFVVLGAGLLLEQAPFIKNVRYMVALELPLRFLAVSFCFRLARRRWFSSTALVGATAVVAMCFWDWQSYRRIFVERRGYDPLSVYLLEAREIIPR
jgi:4-amino-4-deoxy-L-arabinose transferase-like glycosyltransferase